MSKHPSRSSTPVQQIQRSGTPVQRLGGTATPKNDRSRQGSPAPIFGQGDRYVKDPPNNLNLSDPRNQQGTTNDLIGSSNTVPVSDGEVSEEEMKRIQDLARRLNK